MVWVVICTSYTPHDDGSYDSVSVAGVFSTKEKAQEYIDMNNVRDSVWAPTYSFDDETGTTVK